MRVGFPQTTSRTLPELRVSYKSPANWVDETHEADWQAEHYSGLRLPSQRGRAAAPDAPEVATDSDRPALCQASGAAPLESRTSDDGASRWVRGRECFPPSDTVGVRGRRRSQMVGDPKNFSTVATALRPRDLRDSKTSPRGSPVDFGEFDFRALPGVLGCVVERKRQEEQKIARWWAAMVRWMILAMAVLGAIQDSGLARAALRRGHRRDVRG